MRPLDEFREQPPEFWALVKVASQKLGYSAPKRTGLIKRYGSADIAKALKARGLDPIGHEEMLELAARYVEARADLLEQVARPNLMDRDEAAKLFKHVKARVKPPAHLLSMNKQKKAMRHEAYLACLVNMVTHETLMERFGVAKFDHNPRVPLTFARDGMPLRTLSRWMDGSYPNANQPVAAWEIKEYYSTTTFGSRVSDGVYVTGLDGHELNELRAEGVEVKHYLFVDGRSTWWEKGRPYLCRIIDMLHADLLDAAFFGREVADAWPGVVATWPLSPAE